MGIALAPDPALEEDPNKPKPPKPAPLPTAGGGTLGLAPQLAPSGAAAPAGPSAAPPMTAPMTAPAMAPAPTVAAPAAPVDRVKLATDTFNATADSTAPAYAAAQRDTIRNAAALGQIGSGGLRTRTGTLALERERDLDAMRKDLVTKATEGSIADANTAYQQALAGSQQNLAAELGRGQLEVSKGGLQLEKDQTGLNAALAKAGLTGLLDGQETLQAKQQKIQQAVTDKTLSQEDAKIALAQLSNAQQNTLQTEQLGLQKTGQAAQIAAQLKGLSLDEAKLELDKQVASGQLSLAERNQALAAKEQAEGSAARSGSLQLAQTGQAADISARLQGLSLDQAKYYLGAEQFEKQLALQKDQLQTQAAQFGASQEQQLALAKLADATNNREIDVRTEQGQNALLLELARIMGGPSGNVDPKFIQAIAATLGIATTTDANGKSVLTPGATIGGGRRSTVTEGG